MKTAFYTLNVAIKIRPTAQLDPILPSVAVEDKIEI
jgi:hypothetical protein